MYVIVSKRPLSDNSIKKLCHNIKKYGDSDEKKNVMTSKRM